MEQGTRKLYLDDFLLRECDAVITGVKELEEGMAIEIDRTCVYPGGGGQACDYGLISWDDGHIEVTDVSKDDEGIVRHYGVIVGGAPEKDTPVHVAIDWPRRQLNSRLHCAGHILDYAVKKAGKSWKSGRSAHYPHMSFVEYIGDFQTDEAVDLASAIEFHSNEFITRGGEVSVIRVPSKDAPKYSSYIPAEILKKYQFVHIATYPGEFGVCCGGTHVADVREIGKVHITKVRRKNGVIRVSYTLQGI